MARAKQRITTVTTRSGDRGTTAMADGSRVPKTDPHMHAIGSTDELNSFLGLLVSALGEAHPLSDVCARVQQELFDIGAHLATAGTVPCPEHGWLEEQIASLNQPLPPLTEFVIPGGTQSASLSHVCRAVCRRVERTLWELEQAVPGTGSEAARYTNRLSDLLFVMARTLNAGAGDEPQWRGTKKR